MVYVAKHQRAQLSGAFYINERWLDEWLQKIQPSKQLMGKDFRDDFSPVQLVEYRGGADYKLDQIK